MTSRHSSDSGGALLPLLSVLFFLSGASALIYQLLWLRLLGLVFGVTVHAASTVLASFMAGLAVGSYAAGRIAPRVRRPLLWFGAAEALIAASAIATPSALGALQALYASVHTSLPDSIAALTAARFVMSFAVLIVPTVLMGATLPLVMKSTLSQSSVVGARFGLLYAVNTAGAIAGTLAAGLLLIPAFGIRRTFMVAAASNLLVAVTSIAAGRARWTAADTPTLPADESAAAHDAAADDAAQPQIAGSARLAVLLVFTLSGFTSLALEVLWFRVNVLVLRPTVYAFAIMLAAVLAGIALGSAAIAPFLARRRPWVPVLAAAEFLIAAAGLLSFRALDVADDLVPRAAWLARLMPDYLVPLVVTSVVTIVPAMFLMGMAFPVGLHIWTAGAGDPSRVTGRIGTFYSLNVFGAILGSIVTGFVLLPVLGSRATIFTITALTAASALVLLIADRSTARGTRIGIAVAGLAILLVIPVPDPFDLVLAQRFPGQPVIWREEGVQTTVSVHQLGARRAMYLDGTHQAGSDARMLLHHRRIGHLGMALHPNPRGALVVGLGGGATAGAVSQYPFATTEVVELSRAVVNGAAFFADVNYDLLNRPNVTLRVDDGRSHMMLTTKRYDVITADIIQAIHAGAGNLYSADYFRLVRGTLTDSGLAVQWVFGTDAEYKTIMRTFLSVFPNATLWGDGSFMVGSRRPLQVSRGDLEVKLQIPEVRAALAAIGIASFEDLLALYTAGPAEMKRFAGAGPLLSDDRPALEYFLALPREPLDISGLRGDVKAILGN